VTQSAAGYAGDVSPKEAFEILSTDADAVLVDCRTTPEWQFVGVPDLSPLGKEAVLLSWQVYPAMEVQADFAEQVKTHGVTPDQPVLLLCRSGVRSKAAAIALTQAGFHKAFNVAEGFEGDKDGEQHRGRAGGWKAANLPWVQK